MEIDHVNSKHEQHLLELVFGFPYCSIQSPEYVIIDYNLYYNK